MENFPILLLLNSVVGERGYMIALGDVRWLRRVTEAWHQRLPA